jgi:hypothetical protein
MTASYVKTERFDYLHGEKVRLTGSSSRPALILCIWQHLNITGASCIPTIAKCRILSIYLVISYRYAVNEDAASGERPNTVFAELQKNSDTVLFVKTEQSSRKLN